MCEWVRPGRVAQLATVLVAAVALTGCGSSGKTARTTTSEQGLVAIGAGLRGPAGLHATVSANGLKLMSAFAFDARGRPVSRWSGSIVEFDTSGEGLRLVARRIRAPFGLAFYPGTNHLLATLNQRDHLETKTPGDWLALVRDGDDFGFPTCYGQVATGCSGMPAPLAVLDPHAAAGGLAIVRLQLGPALGPAALVAEWSLGKVLRVPLGAHGERATSGAVTFLTGLTSPLPLAVAPDGALLVGDWTTGRVYRITR